MANCQCSVSSSGRNLRGAANFSASGLKRQDNDLIMIESAVAAAAFKRTFDARFAAGKLCRLARNSRLVLGSILCLARDVDSNRAARRLNGQRIPCI